MYMYISTFLCTYVDVYIFIYTRTHIHTYTYACLHTCVLCKLCVYMYIHVPLYIRMYIHIHISYIHAYTGLHIHMYAELIMSNTYAHAYTTCSWTVHTYIGANLQRLLRKSKQVSCQYRGPTKAPEDLAASMIQASNSGCGGGGGGRVTVVVASMRLKKICVRLRAIFEIHVMPFGLPCDGDHDAQAACERTLPGSVTLVLDFARESGNIAHATRMKRNPKPWKQGSKYKLHKALTWLQPSPEIWD